VPSFTFAAVHESPSLKSIHWRGNMAHIRQSRPDSGRGLKTKVLFLSCCLLARQRSERGRWDALLAQHHRLPSVGCQREHLNDFKKGQSLVQILDLARDWCSESLDSSSGCKCVPLPKDIFAMCHSLPAERECCFTVVSLRGGRTNSGIVLVS